MMKMRKKQKRMTGVMMARMIMLRGVGFNQKKIAAELGVAPGTISYQLSRVRNLAEEHGAKNVFKYFTRALDFGDAKK